MIYAVCGPVSPHSILVTQLVRKLLCQVFGEITFAPANEASELRKLFADTKKPHALIAFDAPDDLILQFILRYSVPTILIAESFATLSSYARLASSMDFQGSYRHVSRVNSTLSALAGAPNVVKLKVDDDERLDGLLGRIGSALDLPLLDEHLRTVAAEYTAEYATRVTVSSAAAIATDQTRLVRSFVETLPPDERAILTKFAESYDPLLSGERVALIRWPTDSLVNAENGSRLSRPIDLTGPGRLLTFGPYLHLPQGRWRADLTFSTKDNWSGNIFMFDVYSPTADKVLCVGKGDLPISGAFTTSMEFEVESASHALELRTFIPTGAIEGAIEIVAITLVAIGQIA